jgi:transcriptional regulator of aromatic amino acid metabolism
VEAIGRNSNLSHLSKNWAELRKLINESPARSSISRRKDPKTRLKRFLNAQDVTDIATRYEAGETTQQVGNRYGISKTRVTNILREQGITIRRQGLTDEHISEAATLYAAGRSLAWLGARYGVSHTTVAAALRRQGVELRPRPRWS